MDYSGLDLLVIKVASIAAMPVLPDRHAALRQLLMAKAESDRRRYARKHEILRKLLAQEPDQYVIDSEQGGIVGLTRPDLGFRIHTRRSTLPTVFLEQLANRQKQVDDNPEGTSAPIGPTDT